MVPVTTPGFRWPRIKTRAGSCLWHDADVHKWPRRFCFPSTAVQAKDDVEGWTEEEETDPAGERSAPRRTRGGRMEDQGELPVVSSSTPAEACSGPVDETSLRQPWLRFLEGGLRAGLEITFQPGNANFGLPI